MPAKVIQGTRGVRKVRRTSGRAIAGGLTALVHEKFIHLPANGGPVSQRRRGATGESLATRFQCLSLPP